MYRPSQQLYGSTGGANTAAAAEAGAAAEAAAGAGEGLEHSL